MNVPTANYEGVIFCDTTLFFAVAVFNVLYSSSATSWTKTITNYDEMNNESVNESDEEIRPPYNGTIQPYMFEPTMAPEEAAAHEIVAKTALSEMNEDGLQMSLNGMYVDLLMLNFEPNCVS